MFTSITGVSQGEIRAEETSTPRKGVRCLKMQKLRISIIAAILSGWNAIGFQIPMPNQLSSNWAASISECPKRSLQPGNAHARKHSRDVWSARAHDVAHIAALGDSVTAGLFALPSEESGLAGLKEFRGLSFSMGGDEDAVTVANFLKHYNRHLQGASLGAHRGEWCFGRLCPPWQYVPHSDRFNAAQSGARMANLQHEMNYLVPAIQQSEKYKEDSIKLITIFIGSNDLCMACHGQLDMVQAEELLNQLLGDIKLELPYSIVNLVSLIKVSQIYDVSSNSEYCTELRARRPMLFECSCAFDDSEDGNAKRVRMDKMAVEYNKLFHKLARRFNRKRDERFAVVVDPIFEEMDIRKWNATELLSSVDCFHPSALAHSHMATAIWSNLWRPPSSKLRHIDFPSGVHKRLPVYCPSFDEVIPI